MRFTPDRDAREIHPGTSKEGTTPERSTRFQCIRCSTPQETGILQEKQLLGRWLLPPYGVGFNILVNPALLYVHEIVHPIMDPFNDPGRMLRLYVWLYPAMTHLTSVLREMRNVFFSHAYFARRSRIQRHAMRVRTCRFD